MDFIGPYTADKKGYTNIMIVMDAMTKYGIAIPTKNQDKTTTADALFYDVFMVYGFPAEILSDKGANFMSDVITPNSQNQHLAL